MNSEYENIMEEAEKLWEDHYQFCMQTGERHFGFNSFLSAYHPYILEELEKKLNPSLLTRIKKWIGRLV